jgi:hypothetical protein
VAQQGPPPRRSSRPPASGWQDQPDGPGWQDQPSVPPAWQDQQPPVPSWQDPQAQPPVPSWQDQQTPAPFWQDPQAPASPWQDQQTAAPPWQDQQAPGRPGQHSAPAAGGWPDQAAPPPTTARHSQPADPAEGWPDQAAPPATARHSQPPAPGPGWPGEQGQAGWQGDQTQAGWPAQQVQTEPGAPAWTDQGAPDWPAQPAQPAAPSWQDQPLRGRPATYNPDDPDEDLDEDTPPWAGLSVNPRRPRESGPPRGGPQQDGADALPAEDAPRGLTRRAIATRARKARRKLLIGGGAAIAVVVLAAGGWELFGPKTPAPQPGAFVNSFQVGELRTVPNACQVISGSVLGQYLPGQPTRVASAALTGASESQCTWTLDAKPVYRVLEVTNQAFAPSGLNTGDGSATFGAIDNFGAVQQALTHPAKHTHLPAATVTRVPGLGAQAFSALQVIKGGGNLTDLVTLVVRERNVVVTVALQGLDKSAKGHYGPVSIAELRAGSVAAAREVLAGLK